MFLADFGPSPLADQYNLPTDGSASFVITPSLLLKWLNQSEEIQADSPTTDLFVPLPPGMRIHRRAATPDEVISSPESSPENLRLSKQALQEGAEYVPSDNDEDE